MKKDNTIYGYFNLNSIYKIIKLLKPSDLNRGRGIQLFDSLETLEKLLNELKVGTAEYGNI